MKDILSAFRLKSGFHKLKQEIKKRSRKSHSVSLKAAKYIGILVTINSQKQMDEIEQVAEEFTRANKKVRLLAFTSVQNLKLKNNSSIEIISNEDVDWNLVPKKEKIINFVNNELATQQQSISGFNTELKYYLDKIK